MSKEKAVRAFAQAIELYANASEQEQQEIIGRVVKDIENGRKAADIFTVSSRLTDCIYFTDEETAAFTEPFKTVFKAIGSVARVTKAGREGGGFVYTIVFRRFGYSIAVSAESLSEAKEKFINEGRTVDDER